MSNSESIDIVTPQLDCAPRSVDIAIRQLDNGLRSIDIVIRQLDCGLRSVDIGTRQLDCSPRSVDIAIRQLDNGLRSLLIETNKDEAFMAQSLTPYKTNSESGGSNSAGREAGVIFIARLTRRAPKIRSSRQGV